MKKKIITATFVACFALCAAVWPQTEKVEETPISTETPAVTAPQPVLPEPDELVLTVTTEEEVVEAEPAPEVTAEETTAPASEIEKQAEAEQESVLPALSETIQAPPAQPEPEVSENNLEDMVYVEGFGWIESQGPNHVEYAEDMYENGNKIGIMG